VLQSSGRGCRLACPLAPAQFAWAYCSVAGESHASTRIGFRKSAIANRIRAAEGRSSAPNRNSASVTVEMPTSLIARRANRPEHAKSCPGSRNSRYWCRGDNGLTSEQLLPLLRWRVLAINHEIVGLQLIQPRKPFLAGLISGSENYAAAGRIAPDVHFRSLKTKHLRQAHRLASSIAKQLGNAGLFSRLVSHQ
jgi:hypothetical protein